MGSAEEGSSTSELGPIGPGDVIAGKYRVQRVLGVGGMGVVVAATHLELDEPVAIKVLRQFMPGSSDAARFHREARVVAKLRSEHSVRVRDVGRLDDGRPFMVMDLLEGETLKERIARDGPLAPSRTLDLFLQICDAIAEAHDNGIVHRDIKPTNVLVTTTRRGETTLKVIDFGVSKVLSGDASSVEDAWLTTTENVLGSPHFMPPEQMLSARDVDARADIWALGVTLFFMLTGELPFLGGSVREVMTAAITAPPRRADELVPAVSRQVADAIARCLEKDPEARFQSVTEVVATLRPFASAAGSEVASQLRSSDASFGATVDASVPVARPRARGGRRGLAVVALVAAATALLAVFVRDRRQASAVVEPPPTARPATALASPPVMLPEPTSAPAEAPAPTATTTASASAPSPVPSASATTKHVARPRPAVATPRPSATPSATPAAAPPASSARDPRSYR